MAVFDAELFLTENGKPTERLEKDAKVIKEQRTGALVIYNQEELRIYLKNGLKKVFPFLEVKWAILAGRDKTILQVIAYEKMMFINLRNGEEIEDIVDFLKKEEND